jgi:predicted DNA-binding transcriptional regulator AlpA
MVGYRELSGSIAFTGTPSMVVGAGKFLPVALSGQAYAHVIPRLSLAGKGRDIMSNNTNERWLSRQELADRFGLPVKTLAQWASKGTGPRYARMGRHVRYRLSDVIDWETTRFGDNECDVARDHSLTNATADQVADTPSLDAHLGSAGDSR